MGRIAFYFDDLTVFDKEFDTAAAVATGTR
jgi:hypothetical protein